MKILIARAARSGEPNVNGVLYTEDTLKKALEEKFKEIEHIPVTLQGPYYGLWNNVEFQSVKYEEVIGYIDSIDDVYDTAIYVTIKKTLKSKDITKVIDKIREGYKLGLRYIAELESTENEGIKSIIKDGTMKIICYDLIKVSVVD